MKTKLFIFALLLLTACRETILEEPQMSVSVSTAPADVMLSGNPIWVILSGTAPAGATNYTTLLRIVSTDGALVGSPIIDRVAPDGSGLATYDISGRVDQAVDYEFEFPVANPTVAHPQLCFDITIEAGEEYIDSNGDLQTTWSGSTSAHRILKGGLSHRQQQEIAPEDFYDDFIVPGNFLTWRPDGSILPYTSDHNPLNEKTKLWFIPYNNGSTDFEINIEIEYDNGETLSTTPVTLTYSSDNMYEVSLDISQYEYSATGTLGSPVRMNVRIWEQGTPNQYFEKTFAFDTKYHEENNFIYFKNSLGGIDCLWCAGKAVESVNSGKSIATRPDVYAATPNHKRATQVVSQSTGQRKWDINTGYKSKDELKWLRDFCISDQMWLVDGNYTIPVYLENGESVLKQISRNLDSLDITLIEAHIEKHY